MTSLITLSSKGTCNCARVNTISKQAIEPQTMYHLIAKNKVAEQHILGKHSNCNTFLVTIALLNSQNFKVAITQLSKVQQV